MRPGARIGLAVGLFFAVYLGTLLLWIGVKSYYGTVLAHIGSRPAGWTAGARVEEVQPGSETARVAFSRPVLIRGGMADFQVELDISVSRYSFNVPLTFALIAALFPFYRWRPRTLLEAAGILVFIHLTFIYFLCTLELFKLFTQARVIRPPPGWLQYLLQFLWAFTDNLVIRFEPFLVAVYLWLRNPRRSEVP